MITQIFLLVTNCTNGDLRLVGGNSPLEGRVEICYYNQWGTVCDNSWGSLDARVVCGQLGYSSTSNCLIKLLFLHVYSDTKNTCIDMHMLLNCYAAATALSGATFGAGAGPIVMDDVRCTSTESQLIDCPANFNHSCVHSEDASVRCTISTTG